MPKKFPHSKNGWFSHEDPTCWVVCECGYDIKEIISDHKIEVCPACGRGYKTEFVVWQYEPLEKIDGKQ